ncbi:hypothetical protein PF005_g11817 [Phytophthora fragariae]|uniref:Uncharacterized protein n=1 Tax=Phytophthora fragariae TaxID=53985 RepID=A0A6A3KFU8_9STRA|nr:hypothetical protein PF009_g15891 [Phytophthora fragariae]KAE9002794.1 hypothetical protein PF011_g13161 [Phytophthora fragariae]KAE9103006.1 hypothetical protein PF010_g13909 [Phytophthora fragariae]KAE9141364.1 hypothetical protein PF006_g13214 [Phytophthora fragariae]KAE9209465.1 hypothetical protein PF005_g11817 [Phytophthora fragariae]
MSGDSDVFPALFGALRGRLADRVSVPDDAARVDNSLPQSTALSAFASPSDALLKSLSASDPSVGRNILEQIRADVRANKLQLLRRKRLGLRKMREAQRRQRQRLDAVAAAECDAVLLDAATHSQKFHFFLIDTHAKAAARLQTLFFECIAEMKKALIRMENVAADTTEESESMVAELLRRYEWQLFVARLQQDCGGDIEASLLVPPTSSRDSRSSYSRQKADNSKASVKSVLQMALQEYGPALENGDSLIVRSVITLRRSPSTRRAPQKSSRSTPSLHFGAVAAEMWTEAVGALMDPQHASKPRRTMSSSSSTRRIRRLPPSRGGAGEPSMSAFSTSGGMCSMFRQLAARETLQFPGTACDVPLSSEKMRDSAASLRIPTYISTLLMLASARRSLREISAILERPREQKEAQSSDTIFAPRQMRNGDHEAAFNQPQAAHGDHSIFARASVLQLVQTLYYTKNFLSLLTPPADSDILGKLYPTTLFGEGCLSTLYVPVVDGGRKREVQQEESTSPASSSEVVMHPLDDRAIHELLLIYVARGNRVLLQNGSTGVNPSQQLTSLAYSDAVNTLMPCREIDCNPRAASPFCVIKNARGLCKQHKGTSGHDDFSYSEEFQRLADADIVFVECTVCPESRKIVSARQPPTSTNVKTNVILEMLGTSCTWRSCITSSELHDLHGNSNLCKWHSSVQRFLEVDESLQYVPNESRMREAFLAAESDSMAEKIKRMIQTSSSLLEELSSKHLPQSIKAFFEHVVSAASNRTYQTQYVGVVGLEGFASPSDLEQSHYELQRLVDVSEEIVGTENRVTRELRQLHKLTVYPGVEDSFIQHGFVDLEELQTDIRTRDLGLLLRLSQQKLHILERRRKDEERQVVRRLAPSTSLPSMSFQPVSEQPGWTDPALVSSSVYDVIHVMRKGRQSLLRQQRQDARGGGLRNAPKRSHGLERCASDLAFRVNPYEAKAAPTTKSRAKTTARKHLDR